MVSTLRGAGLLRVGVAAAFFVSGAAGLVHEVAWARLLRRAAGNGSDAIGAVLCAFLVGLALGAWIGGRVADRSGDPLRWFAGLELAIGLYGLALPALVPASAALYGPLYGDGPPDAWFQSVRFAVGVLLLLLPATAMGATLPLLTTFAVRRGSGPGRALGALYAINTVGAAVGAAAGGLLALPVLGLRGTIVAASATNLLVAGGVWWLRRYAAGAAQASAPLPARKTTVGEGLPVRSPRLVLLLLAYGLSGTAALVYQVAWTRVLAMSFGSSVYAFALVLTAFILGLGVGGAFGARWADRVGRPWTGLGWIEAAIGLSALALIPLLGRLPLAVTAWLQRRGGRFWELQALELGLIVVLLIVPTALMGAALPFAGRLARRETGRTGAAVGSVYAANTTGAVVGVLAAGFLLVPRLGLRGALLAAVGLNVAVGVALLLGAARVERSPRWRVVPLLALALGAALALPEWDPAHLSLGPFVQARRQPAAIAGSPRALAEVARADRVVFHRSDAAATVTVKQGPGGERSLWVNGKPDASATVDAPTQKLLAHLPLLLHPRPRHALVIGLASGVTLGSAGLHPLERIDCAEISPSMLHAARLFDAHNRRILDDPRVRVLITDGRNHLALSPRRYDVIVSEPSNPWIAGIADLYTEEFFRLCRRRLAPGGVLCVWLEAYDVDGRSFRSVLGTFRSVFPGATLWSTMGSDFLLIASTGPLELDVRSFAARVSEPQVAGDLATIGIERPAALLAHLVTGPDGIADFAGDAPRHTDDNGLLEFSAPRVLLRNDDELKLIEALERRREPYLEFLSGSGVDAERVAALREEAEGAILARGHAIRANLHFARGESAAAIEQLRAAARLNPADAGLRRNLDRNLEHAAALVGAGRFDQAVARYELLLEIAPDDVATRRALADALVRAGRVDEARRHLLHALAVAEQSGDSATSARIRRSLDTLERGTGPR